MARKQYRKTFLAPWRDLAGFSQEQAAERLGISAGHLSNVENGRRPYTQELLEGAAALYGCEPADLLTIDPSGPDGQKTLLATLGAVPAAQRDAAVRMLRALAEPNGNGNNDNGEPPRAPRRRTRA